MRKIQRPPLAIFSISFLDVISCAFGAVVMLVLLAKNGDQATEQGPDNLSDLLKSVVAAQAWVQQLQSTKADTDQQYQTVKQQAASAALSQQQRQQAIPRAQQTLQQLLQQARSLREQLNQANARLAQAQKLSEPDEEVGGIPTDAEYVIFVIDNSGSMAGGNGWNRVMSVARDILNNHPKMKGFQIVAADGTFLFDSLEGKWIPDRGNIRNRAIAALGSFNGGSSAPEVGIRKVVQMYKNKPGSKSLYVFGDDYRPSSLDATVSDITRLNTGKDGKPIMRIHGIGFNRPQGGNPEQFAAFMQAVAKRNRGAFVGLYF